MFLGSNLQYLRKNNGNQTQEKLAERLGVSRQTVSRWESGEAYPEITKLLDLCDLFHCTLDDLLRKDMAQTSSIYLPIRIAHVEGFRMARYVMISPNPEEDVNTYMDTWARNCGLLDIPQYAPVQIGWDFPYISSEQKNRFGLRGYVSAYVLPEDFTPVCDGVAIVSQTAADYAVMTIQDPFAAAFQRIPQAYRMILEYLSVNGYKKCADQEHIPCFERVYTQNGITCMDVFIHCQGVPKTDYILKFT